MSSNFKKFITLRTIGSKLIIFSIIGVITFSAISQAIISDTVRKSEIESVIKKEEGDLAYMSDYLDEGQWRIENHTLYKGDTLIGDGSDENAYYKPFIYLENRTGSFFYTFIHDRYLNPAIKESIVGKTGSSYVRVAGSTTDPNGNTIVGTYMEANVSQKLDESGRYTDYANVEGGVFHTLYQTITSGNEIIGAIVVGRSVDSIHNKIVEANIRIVIFVYVAFALLITSLGIIITRWIKNLTKSKKYLTSIANGVFPSKPLEIHSRDEMEEMANVINDMTRALKDKERMETELTLATDIQLNMLPRHFENMVKHGYFDIFADMVPAREVGGDFYDFFMVDDKNIAIVIADVSGKGIPAALLMAIAKTTIKNYIISGYSVGEAFSRANNMFSEGNEAGLFITSWMGMLNLETGVLTYVNAGHNPPIIYKEDKGYHFLKSPAGFVLGGLAGIKYRQQTIDLNVGDRIILYTDGVTEAHNNLNKLYGEDRLIKYLNANTRLSIKETINGIKSDIHNFVRFTPQSDDITILGLEFTQTKEFMGVSKSFHADRKELYECLDFINETLDKHGATSKAKNQINLVVEELFVNISDHGYQSVKGYIDISVNVVNDVASVVIRDRGVPFNPLTKVGPDVTLSADDRPIGGLGIFITKKLMDSIDYQFLSGQNILTIRKKIKD